MYIILLFIICCCQSLAIFQGHWQSLIVVDGISKSSFKLLLLEPNYLLLVVGGLSGCRQRYFVLFPYDTNEMTWLLAVFHDRSRSLRSEHIKTRAAHSDQILCKVWYEHGKDAAPAEQFHFAFGTNSSWSRISIMTSSMQVDRSMSIVISRLIFFLVQLRSYRQILQLHKIMRSLTLMAIVFKISCLNSIQSPQDKPTALCRLSGLDLG